MVSIKDVARSAGVSPQTVSNYLNNPGIVKASTRSLVAAAIDELGYTPNASARRLRTQRSNTIAIGIAPVSYSRVYDRFLHAIATEADAHNLRIILYKTDSKSDEIRQFESLTAGGDVDSFVLADTVHNDPRIPWLIEHKQAFVLFGRPWGESNMNDPTVPWVDVDGYAGIALMTQKLILTGHKRIGFIGWPGTSGTGDDRKAGWRDTLLAAKMASEQQLDALCVDALDDIAAGHAACLTLLERQPDLDAIVCVSDTLAAGAVMSLTASPTHNITVTGFDNTVSSQSFGFPTIDQPLTACAQEIVRIIQQQLDGAASHAQCSAVPAQTSAPVTHDASFHGAATVSPHSATTAAKSDSRHVLLTPALIWR
ncbi:LacI family DNA-binding transcriptional regulator [Bifidobacterium oedipodis]|uniref:LacI family transcriptional regulator n=1 Tax=Bifidobacterium oedipodis TaxID=2675322 RepID=A0A7Y0ERB9_9BIFI|nr:LacI family DNA-binding transcriptional regulator [Bifidobacterium sp. DSM 109957]NMM94929.1 LacI family transcriptional regulator [Bifidobacterium sp. DSM 109957]